MPSPSASAAASSASSAAALSDRPKPALWASLWTACRQPRPAAIARPGANAPGADRLQAFSDFPHICGNPPVEGCPPTCGKRRVCRLYQAFDDADDGRAGDDRGDALLHRDLLRLGTDGKPNGYTPLGGDFKSLDDQISSDLRRAVCAETTRSCGCGCARSSLRGRRHVLRPRLRRATASASACRWPSWLSSPSALSARASASRRALEVSVASLVYVFAAVVFGPLAGVVVGARWSSRRSSAARRCAAGLRWLTWTAIRVHRGWGGRACGACRARALGPRLLGLFAAVSAAFAVETCLDICSRLVDPCDSRHRQSWRETARVVGSCLVVSVPLHAPWSRSSRTAYIDNLALERRALRRSGVRRPAAAPSLPPAARDTEALGIANARLASANLSFATALVATLDARDRYTAGHRPLSRSMPVTSRGDGAFRRASRSSFISAVSFTTSARSGYPRASREAGRAVARGATPDGAALRDWRAHPARTWRTTPRSRRSSATTTSASTGMATRTGWRRRDPAARANHRGRGRIQRDDLGPAVPRCDAEPRRAAAACAGRRKPVRHVRRRGVRSDPRGRVGGLPDGPGAGIRTSATLPSRDSNSRSHYRRVVAALPSQPSPNRRDRRQRGRFRAVCVRRASRRCAGRELSWLTR